MSWALSRFKKDGLGNAWVGSLPSFLRFVGVARVDRTNLRITHHLKMPLEPLRGACFPGGWLSCRCGVGEMAQQGGEGEVDLI